MALSIGIDLGTRIIHTRQSQVLQDTVDMSCTFQFLASNA